MDIVSVVGARGFIGRHFADFFRDQGLDPLTLRHDEIRPGMALGTVIYCSGVAWGAERRIADAYGVHVSALERLLRETHWDRVCYLSSTRVYDGAASTDEDSSLAVTPSRRDDAYRISKIAGESLTLGAGDKNLVLRLSNVYGDSFRSGLFLSDLLRQGASNERIDVRSSRQSEKDYVSVFDVVRATDALLRSDCTGVVNIAAGRNTSHESIFDAIEAASGIAVRVPPGAPASVTPAIRTKKLTDLIAFEPRDVIDDIPRLWELFAAKFGTREV